VKTGRCFGGQPRLKVLGGHGGNSRTPLVLNADGTNLVVVWAEEAVTAYEPGTGEERWSYKVPGADGGWDLVASPVAD
jgi:hypothetical protein